MFMVAVEPTLPEVSDDSPLTVGHTPSTQPSALTAVGNSATATSKTRQR